MKDQTIKKDIFDDIKGKEPQFRADIPPHAWSRIESRLDNNKSKQQISFYKLIYNAAIFVILSAVISVLAIYMMRKNSTTGEEGYTQNIQVLKVTNNSYPVYDVHKLQKAYARLKEKSGTGMFPDPSITDL